MTALLLIKSCYIGSSAHVNGRSNSWGQLAMRRFAIGALVLSTALAVGGVLLVVARTEQALRRSRAEALQEATLPFELETVPVGRSEFRQLAAPGAFRLAVFFQGKIVLAGAGGLTISAPDGRVTRELRTGIELPPAPITALSVGVLRGESHPLLMVATRGEGLLLVSDADKGEIRQLRPREKALLDLTAVLPLASGEVLIGTRNKGLLRFDGKTLTPFSPALSGVPITALAGSDSEFWVGTRDRGVLRWHAGELDTFDQSSGLPDNQVDAIALDSGLGQAFIGTPLGIAEFDVGRPAGILAKGLFAHAIAIADGSLAVASIDQGVATIPISDTSSARRAIRSGQAHSVQAESFLLVDHDLFAVTTDGLVRHERGGAWTALNPALSPAQPPSSAAPMLADRDVSALSFAPDGQLWVGYFDRGLDVVNLATGQTRHLEDDHIFCVNRILPDAGRNTVDVATANGLVLFDASGHERQVLTRRDGLIADQVTDIAFTRNGTVLATPSGITLIDASGVSSLYGFQGLVNNHVYALASDAASGTLMAGTLGGISVLGNTTLLHDAVVRRNLTVANSALKQNWITAIVSVPTQDVPQRQEWFVGTYGGGVVRLGADGRFSAMDTVTRPAEINPNAMLVTGQHVFAGSLGDGLFVYDRATQHWSQIKAGLPSLNVTALAQHDGELYVGTENGVVHIAEARLAP
jgi:ligand-binding sensor domain-containing protein